MKFEPRLTQPDNSNKYYIRKVAGGYNGAIQGKPALFEGSVFSNCVGYAVGRFLEIQGKEAKGVAPSPVNAEMFPKYLNGLKTGNTPKLGSIICWAKGSPATSSDGAGHVAVVEKINSDGSIVTSESGWGSTIPFYTKTRNNSNGRWGQSEAYTFQCFIYQPDGVIDDDTKPAEPTVPTGTDITFTVQNVHKGCYGSFVKPVQVILKGLGFYAGNIDGSAGNQTHNAIINYQKKNNLYVDGDFGPKCWDAFLNMK